jgi:hypothetical protein
MQRPFRPQPILLGGTQPERSKMIAMDILTRIEPTKPSAESFVIIEAVI